MPTKRPYLFFHIIGWLAFVSFQLVLFPHPEKLFTNKETYPYLIDQFIINGLAVLFFYFHHYLLFPKFYFERKKLIYVLMILSYLSVSILIVSTIHHDVPATIPTNFQGIPVFSENPLAPPTPTNTQHIKLLSDRFLLLGFFLLKLILVFLLSIGIRVYGRWQIAEEEKYKAELSFLKAQINPHFLFNTLNGIYVLAIKKSENTAPAIMKLSSIMRYVVSEVHKNFVAIEKELKYIADYIDLQKMRLSDNIQVDFLVDMSNKDYKIAPLVLIPFIENAFKHGISTEENCKIKIHIKIVTQYLELIVENKKYKYILKEEEKSGIGVHNTKKRLDVLYPAKHKLNIIDTEKEYIVHLKLHLT